jgi:hypothetical protein
MEPVKALASFIIAFAGLLWLYAYYISQSITLMGYALGLGVLGVVLYSGIAFIGMLSTSA